jgi:hypothetical protein
MYIQGYQAEVNLFSLLHRVYTPGYQAGLTVHCFILRIRKDIKQIFFTHILSKRKDMKQKFICSLCYILCIRKNIKQNIVCSIWYILSICKDIKRKLISVISYVYARISSGSWFVRPIISLFCGFVCACKVKVQFSLCTSRKIWGSGSISALVVDLALDGGDS